MGSKGLGSLLVAVMLLSVSGMALVEVPGTSRGQGWAQSPYPMFRGDLMRSGANRASVEGNHGGLLWTRNTAELDVLSGEGFELGSYGITIGLHGNLYFGTRDPGGVCSVMPNGHVEWLMRTESSVSGSTPAIDAEGNIYVCNDQNDLYAINPRGELIWTGEGAERSSPLIDPDGNIYTGASDIEGLVAYQPDGTLKWTVHIGGQTDTSPAWGMPNGRILFHNHTSLLSISPDGDVLWNLTFDDHLGYALCVAMDGTAYVVGERTLYAVGWEGQLRWTFEAAFVHEHFHPALGIDGTIYIGDNEGLYAISPEGNQRWFIPATEAGVDTVKGIVVSMEGTVIVAVHRSIRALDQRGRLLWEAEMRNQRVSSEPVIGEDGTVYFFGEEFLIALNDEEEPSSLGYLLLFILVLVVVVIAIYARRRRMASTDQDRGPRVRVVEVPISRDLPRLGGSMGRDRPPP